MIRSIFRRRLFPCLVIALAIAGVGLDALPSEMIFIAVTCEDVSDDSSNDGPDDIEVFNVTWPGHNAGTRSPRIDLHRGEPSLASTPLIPVGHRRSTAYPADPGRPPERLPTLLCRLTC